MLVSFLIPFGIIFVFYWIELDFMVTSTTFCCHVLRKSKLEIVWEIFTENAHQMYIGYPVVNDPLYNHEVFGPLKGRGGDIGGKTDEQLVRDLINIHNAENWLGIDGDSELSLFKTMKADSDDGLGSLTGKGERIHSLDVLNRI